MKTSFTVSTTLPAEPERVFRTWLSTDGHSAMTGSPAKVEPRVGGAFSAWDGYITGKTLALRPYSRIVQSWRTSEFSESDPDSQIEVLIEAAEGGALLSLTHSGIPEGQAESYESGWEESYFAPMRTYFGSPPRA
jgi:activator of HSP90 ATPase